MDSLSGKTLIFSDIHFGIKQNSLSRLNICVKAVKQILECTKTQNISNIVFAGDLFHERVSVNVNTLNIALKCIQALAKRCKTYLVVGNHDSHFKNTVDVNSLNMFRSMPNVTVADKALEIQLNGKSVLLCPWLSDLSNFKKEQFDMLIGHFDVPPSFIMSCYTSSNAASTAASASIVQSLQNDSLLSADASSTKKDVPKDQPMSFVELAKKGGIVFAGHIHKNRELAVKGRKFVFIGSPCQQTRADISNDCGWYVLDDNCKIQHVSSSGLPVHVELLMSKVLEAGIDKFDFSCIRGSILHKVYDCEVSRLDDSKIMQKIIDYKPYEELIPEYAVAASYDDTQGVQNETIALIKKSKLEYMKSYIDSIDKDVLAEQQIDPSKLYSLLKQHYEKVSGQQ